MGGREKAREAAYRWVAGRLLSFAFTLVAQPTRYRLSHSDVRAYLGARVNTRVMAINYRVVDPYQRMEQQSKQTRGYAAFRFPKEHNPLLYKTSTL